MIPACRHYGLGLLTYSPVHGGVLGGILQKPPKGGRREKSKYKEFLKKHRNQVEQYEALCKKLGEEPAVVAQAWLLRNPAVTSVIIGPRTLEHLESSIRATEITLDEETLKQLDEFWPGPGSEAPEAYAW